MSAFLIILGVPLIGVLLYSAEQARRLGETPNARWLARLGVLLCGAVLGVIGTVILANLAMWILSGDVGQAYLKALVTFVVQIVAGLLVLWSGACAWDVFRQGPASYENSNDLESERASERLRMSAVTLMFVPLLLLGAFGVLIAVPLVFWGVAIRTARQGRQSQFLWTLALAVRQNLPLDEEIEMFAQPLWTKQRANYQTLADRLRDGRTLGESLEMSSGILPRSMASEIRTAEDAGRLPEVLTDLATRTTTSLNANQNDGSLAITILYGWLLLSLFLIVVGFIMYWIIPKYKDIFYDFGVDLPPMTISLIESSDLVMEFFLLVMPLVGLPLVAVLALSYVYFVSWDNISLPLLMRWFPRFDAPALLRTLSHVVEADRPLPPVLEEMSHRHLRPDVRQRLARMGDSLEGGEPLWTALTHEGFVRAVEADALAAAERADNLPWAMRTLADSMNLVTRRRTQFWLELVKPAVVVGIGLIVGWFVIAMFLPLVQLIVALV